MRRNLVALLGTLSALVLLFSYHTSLDSQASTSTSATAPLTPGSSSGSSSADGSSGGSTSSGDDSGSSGSSSESSAGSGAGSSSGSTSGTKTYTGDVADTRWGPVQVKITVTDGKITAAEPTQVPTDNPRDQEINSYAVPILNQEAVKAQSAQIDAISGATVTSDGYIQSLQSAIDQAHL
jgi:uncharacterized protein with FMN-binding domain